MAKEIQNKCSKQLQLVPTASLNKEQEEMLCKIVHSEEWNNEKMKDLYKSDNDTFNFLLRNAPTILALNDRDVFLERIGVIYPDDTKNSLWQQNHIVILNAIRKLTCATSRFPTRYELSSETNLSKQTINKHLKEYFNSELYNDKKDEYIVLRETVLAGVFKLATQGDTKAAKVFLDATNQFIEPPKIKNQQNNFIQINGLTITQEELKQLPAGKLTQIQKILSVVNKPISKI